MMLRYTLLAGVVVLGLIVLACGGSDAGDPPANDPAGVVVARHVEVGDVELAGVQGEDFWRACAGGCFGQISVHFADGVVRALHVTPDCYRAVGVGDPWPDACYPRYMPKRSSKRPGPNIDEFAAAIVEAAAEAGVAERPIRFPRD